MTFRAAVKKGCFHLKKKLYCHKTVYGQLNIKKKKKNSNFSNFSAKNGGGYDLKITLSV